jgi:hypothetical protein
MYDAKTGNQLFTVYCYCLPGVDDLRSVVLHGRHAPDHEEALGEPVEGNPPNQDI